MVCSKITLVQCKIHCNQFPARYSSVLNVLSMKQKIPSKEFCSLRTVKGTAEGFTKPILQKYVVIFCIVRPNPYSVKKLFSSKECRSGARISNSQVVVLLSKFCCLYFFDCQQGCDIPFPCLTLHDCSTQKPLGAEYGYQVCFLQRIRTHWVYRSSLYLFIVVK